jgi:hypothetical protein
MTMKRIQALIAALAAVPMMAAAQAGPGYTFTDLGTAGEDSVAAAINNNAGQVAGSTASSTNAALWNGTSATDLGTLGGNSSTAYGINSAGQVVGTCDRRATVWNGPSVFDLNSLLDADTVSAGWVLIEATGVNDSGWITGNAYTELTDDSRAFLLPAAPEPESYALTLAGLGIVGVAVRRRKVQRQVAT